MNAYLTVDGAVGFEDREELFEDLLLGLLAAEIARVVLDVVDGAQVVQRHDAVTSAVQLLERLADNAFSAGVQWRLYGQIQIKTQKGTKMGEFRQLVQIIGNESKRN